MGAAGEREVGKEGGAEGREFLLICVFSARRCASINVGLLESSRASEGLVVAPDRAAYEY